MEDRESEDSGVTRRGFLKSTGALMVLGAFGTGSWGSLGSLFESSQAGTGPGNSAERTLRDAPPPFTLFWMTDTQFLSEANPALYTKATNWIVNNWDAFNGKMVVHTGDLVENGYVRDEWVSANQAMSVLLNNNIPYLWCAGNHDNLVEGDPNHGWIGSLYNAFKPQTAQGLMSGLSYTEWLGDYRDGMNTAVRFSANNLSFIVVNIEWNAPPAVLEWVRAILDDPDNSKSYVIIAPHAYEDAYGSTNDQRWGPTLTSFRRTLTELMDEHSTNVFLTLNGHFATDSGYHTPKPINGRNQLMFDRQESTDNPTDPFDSGVKHSLKFGGATVTLLTFDTHNNRLNVATYDPYNEEYRTGPNDKFSLVLFPDLRLHALEPSLLVG